MYQPWAAHISQRSTIYNQRSIIYKWEMRYCPPPNAKKVLVCALLEWWAHHNNVQNGMEFLVFQFFFIYNQRSIIYKWRARSCPPLNAKKVLVSVFLEW